MNDIIDRLRSTFDGLESREKQLASGGVIILIVTAVFALISPMMAKHSELSEQAEQLNADLQWLEQQREVVVRLKNGCASRDIDRSSDRDKLTKLVRRSQLRFNSLQNNNGTQRLVFSGSDANRVMHLAHQVACAGYTVKALDVTRSSVTELKGSMEVVAIES